ncbi:MAG: tautomerase family protein [Pseudomonas sp.]|uniref:tautomerase family protein n=1 Tax=Pseudomonas sp. TaxID=306 RepID=UPI003A8EC1B8
MLIVDDRPSLGGCNEPHESFEVPKTDRFKAIHQHDAVVELIFDSHYLVGQRSQDFVLIAITAVLEVLIRNSFLPRSAREVGAGDGTELRGCMVVNSTRASDEWSFGGERGN